MKKYCFALDLKNDPELISQYEAYHQNVWPEIIDSIRDSGITKLEIFRVSNRLFMIMETTDDFSLEKKARMDAQNPKVQEWEKLMWAYQQTVPGAPKGEKWVLMDQIFKL
jgi:L-rhamnose mutarotase